MAGAAPPAVSGSHVQLCCGEKDMVIVQLCCGASEKADPGVEPQLSCSMKFGNPLKSLREKGGTNVRLSKVAPEALGLVSLIVWLVAADPTG